MSNPGDKIFVKHGDIYTVHSNENLQTQPMLPNGNFVVKFNPENGSYYLQKVESFELPPELYGRIVPQSERIFATFKQRPLSTGVFLEGEKGSGKTLLAKVLSKKVADEMAGPTLIINQPFCGDTFNQFMQNIKQPSMVLFDEFEKVYDEEEHQAKLLTLLDGAFPTKKLFVLTCNEKFRVNTNFKNRPGRLFYMLSFTGLDESFIREYCSRNLKESLRRYTDQVVSVSSTVEKFNFDMLKSLVEEMNRYNESAKQAVEMLNIKPDSLFRVRYMMIIEDAEGKVIPKDAMMETHWEGDISQEDVMIYNCVYEKDGKGKVKKEIELTFGAEDFVSFDTRTKEAVFFNESLGYKLYLRKYVGKKIVSDDYSNLI